MEDTAQINEVTQLLTQAAEAWKVQTNETARAAMGACEQALRLLDGMAASPDTARLRAAAWMQRGQVLDLANQPAEAVRCYDQAIAAIPADSEADSPGLASAHMNRGGALQRLNTPDSIKAAGASFAEAVARLERWPEPRPVEVENTLGAAWMNAGICHARIGDEAAVESARHALDQAIGVLMRAAEQAPVARRNLASAWGNRGVLMMQTRQWDEAKRCFTESITLLEGLRAEGGPAVVLEIANMNLSMAQAVAAGGDAEGAVATVRRSLALTSPHEAKDPRCCDLGLRARHALCVLLAGRISTAEPRSDEQRALVSEAGDVVEEGLALAKGWGENAKWFADPSLRLFEFGGWLYRTQQPRFLAEFIEDNLNEDPRRAQVGGAALQAAREAMRQRSFASLGGEEAGWLQDWTELAERLQQKPAAAQA
ncbi:MAG: hypothetical protein ABII82_14925 [Verrucomicrobiota bacterium]